MEHVQDPTFWKLLWNHRSPEVWAALLGGSLYAYQKSGATTKLSRLLEAGTSGLLSYSMANSVSDRTGIPPQVTHFFLTAVGFFVLDSVRSLIADREAFKELVLRIIGGSSNGK